MTSLVLDTGRRLVDVESFDARSATVGLAAVLLLAGLLVAFAVIVGTRLGHLV